MRLRADFDCGNLADWERAGPGEVRIAARADLSPRPLWFFFLAEALETPELWVEVANADACLGPRHGWATARPVYRPLDSPTGHCPGSVTQSAGAGWQRVPSGRYEERVNGGVYRFRVPCEGGAEEAGVAVAYCYPYTLGDLEAYRGAHLPSPPALWSVVGTSPGGKPLYTFSLGTPGAPAAWVTARQHAGETPSSYVLEGMADWLGAGSDPAAQARAATFFTFAPVVDPDGVHAGRFGKDSAPVDFNRDWNEAPRRPEIAALTQAAGAAASPALFLDLHASHHGDTSCYLFGDRNQPAEDQARFLQLLEEESPPSVGFRRTDVRYESPPAGSARASYALRHGALSLCVEMSYHLAQSGRYLAPADYRAFGAALARASVRYLAT